MSGGDGGETAFGRLYDAHFSGIFRYLLLRTGNVAEAEDLTAQTFYKALRGFAGLRWLGRSERPWLYRIATNELNSFLRHRRIRSRWEGEAGPPDGVVARERETAEHLLERERIFGHLADALRGLDPDEQALVVLRYFERMSYAEIARILRRRKGTLAMRTHRALGKLRSELERRGVNHDGIRESLGGREDTGDPGRRVPAIAAP